MTKNDFLSKRIGDYLWVYVAEYNATISTRLGRIIDRIEPMKERETAYQRLLVVQLNSIGDPSMQEVAYSGDEKGVRFSPCESWDADRWLVDNGIEVKIRKQAAAKEAEFRVAVGFTSMFSALTMPEPGIALPARAVAPEEYVPPPEDYVPPTSLEEEIPF